MRITVDTDRCIGAGQCVLSAPGVFDQDEDGLVLVRGSDPAPEDHDTVYQAGDLCPAHAITVHED
ncbi:ferredoxin [Streptomyces sp. NPDC002835]